MPDVPDHDVLLHKPGFLMVRVFRAETSIPYREASRVDSHNWGYVELKGRPHLLPTVPELRKSKGMAYLVEALNRPDTPYRSSTSEIDTFAGPGGSGKETGSTVTFTFTDRDLAKQPDAFVSLADNLYDLVIDYGRTRHDPLEADYQWVLEPLNNYYGEKGCFAVTIKIFGRGKSSEASMAAHDELARILADLMCPAVADPTQGDCPSG